MSVKERINQIEITKPLLNKVIKAIIFFAIGFGMSLGGVIGGVKPFGVSATAVMKKKNIMFCAIGAIIGYLISGFTASSSRYLVAVIMAGIGALCATILDFGHTPAFSMVLAGLTIFGTGIVLNFQTRGVSEDYLITIGESILASGGAFFIHKSLTANYKRLRFKALPISDVCCVLISISIFLMTLSNINIGIISPARIVAILLVLVTARYGGDRWGMITALAIGFSISINNNGAIFIIGAVTFATLIALLFSSLGCFAMGASFVLTIGFFCVADSSSVALSFFIESLVGATLFILLPSKLCEKLEELWDNGKNEPLDSSLRQSLVMKLRFASSAMATISDSVDQVRERINNIIHAENEKNRDKISEEEFVKNEIILEKTNQIRMVASDQFYSIADMLEDLAFEFDDAEMFDGTASSKIRRVLGDYEIFPSSISVVEDKFGRIRVEILTDGTALGLENDKIRREIGKICSRYFDKGSVTNFKNESLLTFNEKPNYKLSVGFAQHSADGKICGDTVKIINDNKGHSILIISDGMGKGSRAALDGAMGANLLSKLINAGFGFDSALKVVNSALLVKSNDESLATLDIACIDLFTGKCEIFKAGAPASYIIKDEKITKCELSSMPAGILRGIEFAKRTAVLGVDDKIALFSDGITDLGDEWVENTLYSLGKMECQECANYILASAFEQSDKQKIDDMSVIFAKLERN